MNLYSSQGQQIRHLIPKEMEYIYFNSDIVNAFLDLSINTPTFYPQQVSKYPWIELLKEAKDNLTVFRKIEEEAKERGGGRFTCMGGMCSIAK